MGVCQGRLERPGKYTLSVLEGGEGVCSDKVIVPIDMMGIMPVYTTDQKKKPPIA